VNEVPPLLKGVPSRVATEFALTSFWKLYSYRGVAVRRAGARLKVIWLRRIADGPLRYLLKKLLPLGIGLSKKGR
jgi:hypothetical protein